MGKVFRLIGLMCICFVISACNTSSSNSGQSGERQIISIATVQPANHSIAIALEEMKKYIEENSNGKYEVRIFGNGVMGGNSEALELLQYGTLNLVATSGSNVELFADEYKIFGIPYLFNDEKSFRNIMQNEYFIQKIYDSTAKANMRGVAWFTNGVNNFYSAKKIEHADDLKGLKIRVQASEANVKMVEGFGGAATVLAYGEVYTALQNKVIDVGTNPETALVQMKHGEVAKYYALTEHQIFTDMLIANTDFLESVNEDQELFEEAFKLVNEVQVREWDAQIEQLRADAKAMGVEFVKVDKTSFMEAQEPVKQELLKQNPVLKELYEQVQIIQNEE